MTSTAVQPYHLVLIGEKSSLEPVLGPAAEEYGVDLYLPTGEISDTQVYRIADTADPRPLVLLYFADYDPGGWQMPISVGRKLQAFKALLPRDAGRADQWQAAFGVEQTEIDAIASLRPDLLRELVDEAVTPFYDRTLASRVAAYRHQWAAAAQAVIAAFDTERLAAIRRDAEDQLADMQEQLRELNDALRIDIYPDELPDISLPEAEVTAVAPDPLVDSRWDFAQQSTALIDSKSYRSG